MRTHGVTAMQPVFVWAFLGTLAAVWTASVWGQSGTPSDAKKKKDEKVQIRADLSVDKLPAGDKCQINIRLTIEPGWHINAVPNSPNTYKTQVEFKGKLGTKLGDLKFPKGKPLHLMDLEEPVSVYDGKVDIRGVLEIPAAAAGQTEDMEIAVKYQACNDEKCLLPTTVKLVGKLPVAKPGDAVKRINEKLFPPTGG